MINRSIISLNDQRVIPLVFQSLTRYIHDKEKMITTIEYQKRVHLNWERLPGYLERDAEDEETGENFGDGFGASISIPFTRDGIIQSPFSDDSGKVYPPGSYFHGVPVEQYLKYKEFDEPATEWDGPVSGGNVQWNVPNPNWPTDGKWVEQCLGALIQAKAKVILEDNWGGRFTNWVHDTQFFIDEKFEGIDQNEPFPE